MRVQTPEAILSYPNFVKPRAVNEGDDPKYSCTLIFHESTDISELKKIALTVAEEKFGKNARDLIEQGKVRWPFRGDVEAKGYVERAGEKGCFLNVRSTRRPGVVAAYADPETGRPYVIPTEQVPEAAYPGVHVRGLLDCYAYDMPMNKGVTFGLTGVQILRPGERLDGRVAVENAFEADPDASPEDFADLPGAVEPTEDGGEPTTTTDEDGTDGADIPATAGAGSALEDLLP